MVTHCEKIHLCDSCAYHYPKCDVENVTFGNGKGNDNVIECNDYNQGDKECMTCPIDCMSCIKNSQSQILDKLCEYNSSGQKMSDFIQDYKSQRSGKKVQLWKL